jgi:hypothetical protein
MNNNVVLFFVVALVAFIIYLAVDFFSKGPNGFFNKWALKFLWIWLPFYAFYFLIKKLFGNK